MVEFRTNPPGNYGDNEEKESSGGTLDKLISYLEGQKKQQAQIALAVEENYGVDSTLLAGVMPDLSPQDIQEVKQQAQEAQQAEQTKPKPEPRQTTETMPEEPETVTKEVPKEVSPEELLSFVDEIIGYTGEDTTLGELREWGENNKDILETAIAMEL